MYQEARNLDFSTNGNDRAVRPEGAADYSGFVIVRLNRALPPGRAKDLPRLCEELKLRGLGLVLDRLGDVDTRRVISSLAPDELLELEKEAVHSELPPLHSLTSYWRIDGRGVDVDMDVLVRTLNQLPEVDLAYRELQVTDPLVSPGDDTWNATQNYLDPAPTGIDARWAWNQPNGDGADVGVVDLEQGWIPTHEDLTGQAPALIFGTNRHGVGSYVGDHGTAVLGEVAAVDNNLGVVGIATATNSVRMTSHYDGATNTALHVADAIIAAIPSMGAGDVLLLEVQRSFLPTETDPADLDAIRLACAWGIVVVEAAGNGSTNLDTWVDGGGNTRLNRGSAAFQDSGAIMVGAANAAVPHDRVAASNFGSRIDCYAYGNGVVTCGYGDLAGNNNNNRYTATFQNTSAASPIITGAAMVLQSLYKAATMTPLSPLQMRSRLSDPATGTPQGGGMAGNIGVMPDLRAIAETSLELVPDVYLRDFVGDSGQVPSTGAISASPDVIVRPAVVGDPNAEFGEGSPTVNDNTLGGTVEAGQDNFIYVRMRNRGGSAATDVRVNVWWSPVATLLTPGSWNLIGTTAPVIVPTGDTLVVAGPVTWPAADVPAESTHACFIAIANAPGDGVPPLPGAFDWDGFRALIRNQNNVTWRNFNVVDVVADPSADPSVVDVLVAGAPDERRIFDLEILQQMPEDARVAWQVPPGLFALLPPHLRRRAKEVKGDYLIELPALRVLRLPSIVLPKAAAFPCKFVVRPGKGMKRGVHRLAIRQIWEGFEVGRVTWALRPVKHRTRRRR